jgi:hypothetical protein
MATQRTWQRTPTGAYRIEHRGPDGRLHRWGGPALIVDDPDNLTRRQEHHRHGRLHNPHGPAILRGVEGATHADESVFYLDNEEHRDGGPSWTQRVSSTGQTRSEQWCQRGELDRRNGPAIVFAEPGDPQRIVEEWWRNGEPHQPSAHEQLAWARTKQQNGGPFHPEPPFAFHREQARPAKTSYRSKRYDRVL